MPSDRKRLARSIVGDLSTAFYNRNRHQWGGARFNIGLVEELFK